MKLHYSAASPYTRKVVVVAHEKGLSGRLELVRRSMTPVSPDAQLIQDNPLGKIPCLVTDDSGALFDSRVICAYLDSLVEVPQLYPSDSPLRWRALRDEALADGIMDAAVSSRYERAVRPAERQWDGWLDGQGAKIERALDAAEAATADLADRLDVGTIAIGCALGYLDFRFPEREWRRNRPNLAGWYEGFSARPSMQATLPA